MFEKSVKRALACCVVAGTLLLRGVMAEDSAPAPVKLENKDVAAYVVVQDLKKTLAGIEKLVMTVAPPGQYQPGQMAQAIGQNFGDPALANLDSKPIALLLFKSTTPWGPKFGPPPIALMVPLKEAEPTKKVFETMGMKTEFIDGVLVGALTDESLAKAKAARKDYDGFSGKLTADARACVDVPALLAAFDALVKPQLQQGRETVAALITLGKDQEEFKKLNISPELATQLTHLIFNVVEGTLAQSDAIQLDITVKPEGLLIDHTYAAKPGTLAAELLSGKTPALNSNVLSFLTKGFISGYVGFDAASSKEHLAKIIDAIKADPRTAPLAATPYVTKVVESLELNGGYSVVALGPGEDALDIVSVATIKEGGEEKMIQSQLDTMNMFTKDGFIAKAYAQSGVKMDMSVEKGVRQHGGALVNKMKIEMEMGAPKNNANLPPEVQQQIDAEMKKMSDHMKKIIPQPEFTALKGYLLTAGSPARLDSLIDKVAKGDFSPSPVTLKSMTLFGKGMNAYADYDLIGYMKFLMQVMQAPGAAQFKDLKDTDAMLLGGAMNNGRIRGELYLPFQPFIELSKMVAKMRDGVVPATPEKAPGQF